MARRVIKGVGQLNPSPIVLPTFKEFVTAQKDAQFTDTRDLQFGTFGIASRAMNHPALRVVQGYSDLRAANMTAQTYPVGWVYPEFFRVQPHSQKVKRAFEHAAGLCLGHILRHEENSVIFVVPYIDNRYGLVLVICFGRPIRANKDGVKVKCENLEFVVRYSDVLAVKETTGPSVSWFWLDPHYSHNRMAYLVSRYRETHGEYPLYKETVAAFERHQNRKASHE